MIELNDIHSPADIKSLDVSELKLLSAELRAALLKRLAAKGGHVGPNLGVVEATVALHYVFDAPKDKIVFDVSHQTYVHKMLTGRIDAFIDSAHYGDVTGYTCPAESVYDLFEIGHTSTSIALAVGLAKARDLTGGSENIIAFIGDASLGGGMALEALTYAPTLNSNLIVILNDNQMSIAENCGAFYDHIAELRKSNGNAENNIFKALGYQYIYVGQGNDTQELVRAFEAAKDADHAVLIHINTMKGEGLPAAEAHKEHFHYTSPFDLKTGAPAVVSAGEDYTDLFARRMLNIMQANPNVVTLTAGTPGAIGFTQERRVSAGRQFIDVGICEQEAVTVAAGMAKGKCSPVLGVMATFIQRSYDQLSHDIAINNLPAVIVDFAGGIWGIRDVTHLGLFDIAMISNIPNILFLAPANAEEYESMLEWSVRQKERPVVIRTPTGEIKHASKPVNTDFIKYDVVKKAGKVAIIGAGSFFCVAEETANILGEKGIEITLINPRNLSNVDTDCLDMLRDYDVVVTLEDGIVDGGFGQKVAAYLGSSNVKVYTLGFKKEFIDRYNPDDVMTANGLMPSQIATLIEC